MGEFKSFYTIVGGNEGNKCFYHSYDRLRHNKPLEYLVRQNIISINDDKQLMVNPRIAFACKYTEENMEALDKMYQHFRTTGEFTPYFKSS